MPTTDQARGQGFDWRDQLAARQLCRDEKVALVEKLCESLTDEQRKWLLELARDRDYDSFALLRETVLR